MADTDSAIKQEWERALARWNEYQRTKMLPAGVADETAFIADLKREFQRLDIRWQEIQARRSRGEQPNADSTDKVLRVVREVALLSGLDVKVWVGGGSLQEF